MDLGAVLVALFTVMIVKLLVMGLGARLLLRLYRAGYREPPSRLWVLLPREDLGEVHVLWWSLVLFFVSELVCGVEVYVLSRAHWILTGIHGVTSALGMGLFALGMFLLLDRRLLRYGRPACHLRRICRTCTVEEAVGCRFRLLLLLAVPLLALGSLLPFLVPARDMPADMGLYQLPWESWNAWFDVSVQPWMIANVPGYDPTGIAYVLPRSMFVLEFRILPAIGLVLAVGCLALIRSGRERGGLRLAAFVAGGLSYVYMELVLYPATADVLGGSLGHELLELWFLLAVAELLRVVYGAELAADVRRASSPARR